MFREIKQGMITAEALEKNNKTLRDDLQTTIATAVNSAIDQHVKPLVEKQKALEAKFEELIKRIERMEVEHSTQQQKADEPHAKRACSADRGQPSSSARRAPQRRHFPDHAAFNPIIDRTIRLTGFKQHLTPDEMLTIVRPLLTGHEYERVTSARPRSNEARVVFKSTADRDAFRRTAISAVNPTFMDAATEEVTTLYWNLPETKEDRHRSYIVRRLRDSLPNSFPNMTIEVNQRSGRIFANALPLMTVSVNRDSSELQTRFVDRPLRGGPLYVGRRGVKGWGGFRAAPCCA